jgi:hypothetical protein
LWGTRIFGSQKATDGNAKPFEDVTEGQVCATVFLGVKGDQQDQGISWESLAASAEANLRFPGSTLVEEDHRDEGEGWGFDNVTMDAMLLRHWTVDAEPDEVMDWFSRELVARGWTPTGGAPFKPGLIGHSSFARETSHFMLRVFGRAETRPWWTFWRRTWNDGGLHYDVSLSASSA